MTHITRLAAILVAAVLVGMLSPGAAQAIIPEDPPAEGTPCDPNDWPGTTRQHTWVKSAEVDTVLTHFVALNVAPGTTGTRTDTVTKINTVTTMFGLSIEINQEASAFFVKVSQKVGFSVQTTTSSTDTTATSMTWSISQPGYYGLYKGTRRVVGTSIKGSCLSLADPAWKWRMRGPVDYTTYAHMEEGTITCDPATVPPPGSLRELARRQLGC